MTKAQEAIVTGTAAAIVTALGEGPATARDLSQRLSGISYANLRQTLRRMASAGIVTNPQRGIYSLHSKRNGESAPGRNSRVVTDATPGKRARPSRCDTPRDEGSAERAERQRGPSLRHNAQPSTYSGTQIDRAVAGSWAHFEALNDVRNQEAWA